MGCTMAGLCRCLLLVISLLPQTQAQPLRIGGDTKPPVRVKYLPPTVDKAINEPPLKGTVILELLIDPAGKVMRSSILKGQDPLSSSAVAAAQQWQYEPTLDPSGKPAWILMTVIVNFPPPTSPEAKSPLLLPAIGRLVPVNRDQVTVVAVTTSAGVDVTKRLGIVLDSMDFSNTVDLIQNAETIGGLELKFNLEGRAVTNTFRLTKAGQAVLQGASTSVAYRISPTLVQQLLEFRK